MNILLVEPNYKNKYPPLGLMKISTYHKRKGDNVVFCKGNSIELRRQHWDRIYISTLFTFYWGITLKTIMYYLKSVSKPSDIYVGGVMATMLGDEIEKLTEVTIIKGLINENGQLGYQDEQIIDNIMPDYSIINCETNEFLNYIYPTSDAYIAYATRGCIRKCPFCAVPIIEPKFSNNISIKHQVDLIKNNFGEKRHLLLMDNNILASKDFPLIIEEIKSLGFSKNSQFTRLKNGRKYKLNRYVDFNQGIDARLLTREKMELLSQIAINPLRIAFDDVAAKELYIEKIRLAAEYGIETLSNYILFNYKDTPEDLYQRLRINVDLNSEFMLKGLKSQVWSFPMKFSPIIGEFCKTRKFVGEHWNKKYLRAIQCILLPTHGVVGPKKEFFEKAFGRTPKEFIEILCLPETYIIYRNKHSQNGDVDKLQRQISMLSDEEKKRFWEIVFSNNFADFGNDCINKNILSILEIYQVHS
jgi:hypothetical protein